MRIPLLFGCTVGASVLCALRAQNLVPNPSFEQLSSCPNDADQLVFATGWNSYGFTVDLFNTCDGSDTAGVPLNYFGYQQPYSGAGYAGLITYGGGGNYHEVLGAQLIIPLTIGQTYHVAGHFAWTASTVASYKFASNMIGMMFRTLPLLDLQWLPWPNYAHVYTQNIVLDSMSWTTIEGDFVADSAYQYIFIGNFFDDVYTDVTLVDPNGQFGMAYYYVDEICVIHAGGDCAVVSSVARYGSEDIHVLPNPFAQELVIMNSNPGSITVQIFNLVGELVLQTILLSGRTALQVPELAAGSYILRCIDINGELHQQLLIRR